MRTLFIIIPMLIINIVFIVQANAQYAASHRMLIIPTASPLPDRVTLGAHIMPVPITIVPQITIPFGSQVGTIIYFGAGGYEGTAWGLGSVAIKYSPLIPDSSHFGIGILGQTVAALLGGDGWFGGTISSSIQFIGSSPIKRTQLHGGLMVYNNMKDWNISPLLGVDFSATDRVHILTEFMTYKPGPYSNLQYFFFAGLRYALKNVSVDIGTGISLEWSEWDNGLRNFWIPPIIATTVKF